MRNELFTIGPLTVYGYGFMIAVGVIAAWIITNRRAEKQKLDHEHVFSLVIWSRFSLLHFRSSEKSGIYQTFDKIQLCSCISLPTTLSNSVKKGSVLDSSVRVIRTLIYQILLSFACVPFFRFRAASFGT